MSIALWIDNSTFDKLVNERPSPLSPRTKMDKQQLNYGRKSIIRPTLLIHVKEDSRV